MSIITTLVEVLQARADERGDKTAFTLLADDDGADRTITFAELDRIARSIAAQLQQRDALGARVLLLYPPGIEFIGAFLGCLYAGAIAVPSYPPHPSRADRSSAARLVSIIQDAAPALALTTPALEARAQALCEEWGVGGGPRCLVPSADADVSAADWSLPDINADTVAFLQYTSGATATPKGVLITHGNVMHNLRSIHVALEITDQDSGVNWLPPYHDMGLIGGLIQPVYEGSSVVLLSPVSFLQRPVRWLETISRFRATISGGPNFAYDLCARRVTPEQSAGLDLSGWRAALNGAEPIRLQTLEAFEAAFAPCGFSAKSWSPCYGLAESTLFVSGGPLQRRFQRKASERELVSCGSPTQGTRLLIVNPDTRAICAEGTVGEIWVQSVSVGRGYWNKPSQSEAAFRASPLGGEEEGVFLRTGDLGFLEAGELFVTGRLQDMVMIGDRMLYPQGIEATAEASHPALRRGACAAFALDNRLIVLCEVERPAMRGLDTQATLAAIRQAISREQGVEPAAIGLLKTATISKTSSGKIQRFLCRELYRSGRLETLALEDKTPSSVADAA